MHAVQRSEKKMYLLVHLPGQIGKLHLDMHCMQEKGLLQAMLSVSWYKLVHELSAFPDSPITFLTLHITILAPTTVSL